MVKEVISIHVGQAGIQLANANWELFCLEHSLDPTGEVIDDVDSTGKLSFFNETSNGHFKPRAALLDLEATVLDEVRTGKYKDLYAANMLVNSKEDAANNYARGYYTIGHEMIEDGLEPIRKMADGCEGFQGFLLYHSAGGGTGSGFHSLLVEQLYNLYPKKGLLDFAIYPSPQMATSVVEPYNVVLSTNSTLDHVACCFLADNEAMYNICHKNLEVDRPTYVNLNRLLAQSVSSMTTSLRFDGVLNADFSDFQTNLVPFPRVHFPLISYAPTISEKSSIHESISVSDMTLSAFDKSNQLVKCDTKNRKYIACCLLYRGDVVPKDVNQAIQYIKDKKTLTFVDWCLTGIKVGMNYQPPYFVPEGDLSKISRALCVLANTTAIVDAWSSLNRKFHLMYTKRAFIHWYTSEGMDIDEFDYAKENLIGLEMAYQELANDSQDN